MTVRSTMKSYCKILEPVYGASSLVDFNDTIGTVIDCNYITVDCTTSGHSVAGKDDTGYYIAQPSGVYTTQILTLANAAGGSGTGNHNTSGIGGAVGTAGGRVELSLNSNDKAKGLILWNYVKGAEGAGEATFVVTYGNKKMANTRRDQDSDFYPPGV